MAEGQKFDTEKPRLDLVPPRAVLAIAEVLTFGAGKYGDRNWEQGIKHGRLYAAAQRHLLAYQSGEDLDPESGLPHIAHAACNLAMLTELTTTRPDLDDRPGTGGDPEKIRPPERPQALI